MNTFICDACGNKVNCESSVSMVHCNKEMLHFCSYHCAYCEAITNKKILKSKIDNTAEN